jgi:hypothetical protein
MLALAFAAGPWSSADSGLSLTARAFGQQQPSDEQAHTPPAQTPPPAARGIIRSGVSRVSMPPSQRRSSGTRVIHSRTTTPVVPGQPSTNPAINPTVNPALNPATNPPPGQPNAQPNPQAGASPTILPSGSILVAASPIAPPAGDRPALSSGIARRTQPPAAPRISAQSQRGSLAISWQDVTWEGGYSLQRATFANGSWQPTRTTFSLPRNATQSLDAPAPGTYAYRIGALSNSTTAFSPWTVIDVRAGSGTQPAIGASPGQPTPPPPTPPATPTNLSASDTTSRMARVSWTFPASSGPVSTIILERDPAFARPVVLGPGIASIVDASGAGTFRYRARALGPHGQSAFSDWAQVEVQERAPSAPTSLASTTLDGASEDRIRLSWTDASDNEKGFVILWQSLDAAANTWSNRPPILTLRNATQQLLAPGAGQHRFRVLARNDAGDSAPTDEVGIVLTSRDQGGAASQGGSSAAAPTGLSLSQTGPRLVALSWIDPASDETGFEIERSPAFAQGSVRVDANQTLFTDSVASGVTSYRVRTLGSAPSEFSPWVSITINQQPPTAPSDFQAVDAGDGLSVRLSWQDESDDETGFAIEHQLRSTAGAWGATRLLRTTPDASELIDRPGLGTHRYRIASVNTAGPSTSSPWRELTIEPSATPAAGLPPAAPSNVVAIDQGTARAGIVWTDNSSNESGFEIRRSPAFSAEVKVSADVSAYVDSSGAGQFAYSVRALSENGPSDWSEWANVRINEVAPTAPSSIIATDQGNQRDVRITWNDTSDNEAGFRIIRSAFVNGAWGATTTFNVSRNVTSYLDAPGAGRFRYRVVAFNAGGENASTWATMGVTDGWTTLPDGPNVRRIYVSSSQGNDSNDGLSPDRPKRTIFAGFSLLRDNSGDQLLLRRGDTFVNQHLGDIAGGQPAGFNKTGKSADEPLIVATYGDAPQRPLILSGPLEFGMNMQRGDGMSHVWIVGLHFKANTRLPGPDYVQEQRGGPQPVAIRMFSQGEDFLFEDLKIENYCGAFAMLSPGGAGNLRNVRVRRCVIVDQFPTVTGHSQGLFATGVDGLLVDECVFDHNGWTTQIPGRPSTIFNHNLYLEQSSTNVVVRNCISARASATGIQMRGSRMDAINNLLINNPLALVGGHQEAVVGQEWTGSMLDNVILGSGDIGEAPNVRPHGFGIMHGRGRGARIERNIVAHNTNSVGLEPGIATDRQISLNMTIADNIIYNWTSGNPEQRSPAFRVGHRTTPLDPTFVVRNNIFAQPLGGPVLQSTATPPGGTWSGNTYYTTNSQDHVLLVQEFIPIAQWISNAGDTNARNQAPSFPEPNRSIASYMEQLGASGGLEEFLAQARLQSRSNWRTEFTAQAVNAYIREGFGRPANPGPLTSASGQ